MLWGFDSRLGMTLAVMLVGMGIGFGMPAIMSLASLRVDSSEQGRVAGLASACPSLGFVLGPLVGTGLYTLDHRFPYMLVVMLMVPLAVLAQWRDEARRNLCVRHIERDAELLGQRNHGRSWQRGQFDLLFGHAGGGEPALRLGACRGRGQRL